ncbi:MAG: membrane protein [Bradymonadia bacterium]
MAELWASIQAAHARYVEQRTLPAWQRGCFAAFELLYQGYRQYVRLRAGQRAGGLTYFTALALVPVLAFAIAVVDAIGVLDTQGAMLLDYLVRTYMPLESPRLIAALQSWVVNANATYAGLIGISVTLYTSIMLFTHIDRLVNDVWHNRRLRPLGARLLLFWAVFTLAPPLVAASVAVTTRLRLVVHSPLPIETITATALSLLLTGLAVYFLARVLPNTRVTRRSAMISATFVALAFEGSKLLFYVLGRGAVTNWAGVYGPLFLLPLTLFWVYATWTLVIIGLVIGYVTQNFGTLVFVRHRDSQRYRRGLNIVAPLEVLAILVKRFDRAGPSAATAQEIAHDAGLSVDDTGEMLERLQEAGAAGSVDQAEGVGWQLSRSPDKILLADVLQVTGAVPPGETTAHEIGHTLLASIGQQDATVLRGHLRNPTGTTNTVAGDCSDT